MNMKRFFLVLACLLCLFAVGCSTAPLATPQNTSPPMKEVIAVQISDIPEDADINAIIVPAYLPQKLSDGKEVRMPAISKSGDKATISTGKTILVEIYYTRDVYGFPEQGKAEISGQSKDYALKIRLNSQIACTLKSTQISREELIRVANSFYIETGPAKP
jgi:hypothetical protein